MKYRLLVGLLWVAIPLAAAACAGGRQPARDEQSSGRDEREPAARPAGVWRQLAFPHAVAEGHGDGEVTPLPPPSAVSSPSPSASADASASPSNAPPSSPPDPEPLRMAEQWEYDLAWQAGKLWVRGVTPRRFASPVVSARRFGRFAIELWIGSELVERVRFDFPGLALEEPSKPGARRPLYGPTDLGRGADVQQTVLVPAAPRARKALLVDRATGEVIVLLWPPDQGVSPPPPASSATSSSSASTSAPAPTPPASAVPPGSASGRGKR